MLNQKVDALIVAEALKTSGSYDDAGAPQLPCTVSGVGAERRECGILCEDRSMKNYYLRTLMGGGKRDAQKRR